jgi:hypothetical protein
MRWLKLAHHYMEFAADTSLLPESLFVWSLHAEIGFIYFKGWCPFKLRRKYKHLNSKERAGY